MNKPMVKLCRDPLCVIRDRHWTVVTSQRKYPTCFYFDYNAQLFAQQIAKGVIK